MSIKALKVEENVVETLEEIMLRGKNSYGLFIKFLGKRNDKKFYLDVLYIPRNEALFAIDGYEIHGDTKRKLSSAEIIKIASEFKNDIIIADVYHLDEIETKLMMLEAVGNEKPEEEVFLPSTVGDNKLPSKSVQSLEYKNAPTIIVDVEGIDRAKIEEHLENLLENLSEEGFFFDELSVRGTFKKYPFGEGGILNVELSGSLYVLKELSPRFDVVSFIEEHIKNSLKDSFNIVVVIKNTNIRIL